MRKLTRINTDRITRIVSLVVSVAIIFTTTASFALSPAQRAIYDRGVFYYDQATKPVCSDSASQQLSGGDNKQKSFNYFKAKLGDNSNADLLAAAIVGNLIAESSIKPDSHQAGGGVGKGIAQWSDPGRWNVLEKFAKQNSVDPWSLATQLDYMWAELTGTAPDGGGNYSGVLTTVKQKTTIEDATAFFMGTSAAGKYPGNVVDATTQEYIAKYGRFGGFENPGTPHLDRRITAAKQILADNGGSEDGSVDESAVTGTDASCASSGSVNCVNPTTETSDLSVTRQNAVCLATAEFALWDSGELKPGGSPPYAFYKYSQGDNEEWCADFASWVYNQANYPLSKTSKEGRVPAVMSIKAIGQDGGDFIFHSALGYTPVPGDLIIHEYGDGGHHVNMVISVNASKKTMVVIGGNEAGTTRDNQTSRVNKSTYKSFAFTDGITGYVSPAK